MNANFELENSNSHKLANFSLISVTIAKGYRAISGNFSRKNNFRNCIVAEFRNPGIRIDWELHTYRPCKLRKPEYLLYAIRLYTVK